MGRWRDFALPDGSYSDDTRPWAQQDVCNYLPTFAEGEGTRSRLKLATAPGLRLRAVVGSGPHRGARDVEGVRFIVSGNKLYRLNPSGVSTELGTIPGTRRVSMTHNQVAGGNQLVIATGDNSYVYDTAANTLTATGIPLVFVDFINQVIVGVDVARRFWRYSGLADATAWNALDNESAESSPDRIVGLIVSQGEVLIFGERTIEVWANAPTDTTSFQRTEVIEKGCINGHTIQRLDNTVFFVGDDFIPYRLKGYAPVPIASKAITGQLAQGDPTKLFSFTWEDRGYACYYLTAQDGHTWGYDVTCQRWHRRESFGLSRWRLNTLFKWNGGWWGGDYSNGRLYMVDWDTVYDGCEIMPRSIRAGVLHNGGNPFVVHALKVLLNTGRAPSANPATNPPSISGGVPDGRVGDVVDYAYTVTPAYFGQPVSLVLTGSLPDGLSMDASGRVTGTRTASGSFSWTITPSSPCADSIALSDSSTSALEWLATRSTTTPSLGRSADGSDWTTEPLSNPGLVGKLIAGGGRVICYSASVLAYSDNFGVTWTIASGIPGIQPTWQGAYYGGKFYVPRREDGLAVSADGLSWSAVTPHIYDYSFAARAGLMVRGGGNGVVSVSTDEGVSWSPQTSILPGGNIYGAATNGSRIVVGNAAPTPAMAYTDDGITWTPISSPFTAGCTGGDQGITLAYGDGIWVAALWATGSGTDGQIAYSADGVNWSLSADTLGGSPYIVYHRAGRFIVAGFGGKMKASADAVAWTDLANNFGTDPVWSIAAL